MWFPTLTERKKRKFIEVLTLINGRFVFSVALNVLGKPLIKFLM